MSTNRFEVLFELKRFDQLLAEATLALGQNQEDVQAALYQLLALIRQESYSAALEAAERVQAFCGFDSLFWNFKGYALLKLEQYREAQICAEKALSLEPNDADNQDFLGRVLMYQADIAGAQAQFIQALQTDPKNNQAWLHLVQLYGSACMRPDLARQLLKTYLAREPHDDFALGLLADYSQSPMQKNRLLRQVLTINPMNMDAHQELNTRVVNSGRFAWVFIFLLLIALASHNLDESLQIYIQLGLLFVTILLSAWLFSWSKYLPAISLFSLMMAIGFPPSLWNPVSLIITLVFGMGIVFISYGIYWIWGKTRKTS